MVAMHTISEHLFVFPFSWKCHLPHQDLLFNQHRQIKGKGFKELQNWKEHISTITRDQDYNEYVYFYKPIRMALYTFEQGPIIVRNYKYKGIQAQSHILMKIDGRYYKIYIREIDLKLYKTGIGLLSFNLINTLYKDAKDIECINRLSECVYPPIMPIELAVKQGFPEQIIFNINENERIKENFDENRYSETIYMTHLIMDLLGESFSCSPHLSRNKIFIEPILGNQMFCCCRYHLEDHSEKICSEDFQMEILEKITNRHLNKAHIKQINSLKREEYCYLKGDGHIYAISRFILLCVTSDSMKDRLYDQLVKLVLMQRATLLNLSSELSRISTLPKSELSEAISSIYEIYIQYINQLYFKEVTEEFEGAYIYEQLSKVFKIDEELQQLDFEINEVHEYANLVEQSASNIKVQLLTIIGAALVIPSFVTGFFGMNIFQKEALHWWDNTHVILWLNSYVILPILVVIALCTWTKQRALKVFLIKALLVVLIAGSMTLTIKYGSGI